MNIWSQLHETECQENSPFGRGALVASFSPLGFPGVPRLLPLPSSAVALEVSRRSVFLVIILVSLMATLRHVYPAGILSRLLNCRERGTNQSLSYTVLVADEINTNHVHSRSLNVCMAYC